MGLIRSERIGHLGNNAPMVAGMGGAESNAAIALARLGNEVSWVGKVGDDDFGRLITRELRAENVQTFGLLGRGATGLMVKTTPLNGLQDVVYSRSLSAGSELSNSDISDDVIAAADVLHLTGITLALSDSARQAAFHAVEVARAAGVKVSFDVNYRAKMWSVDDAHRACSELATQADIVFAGFDEVRLLLGDDVTIGPDEVASALSRIVDLGAQTPVVKEGTLGSWSLSGGTVVHVPAVVVPSVDTVGAGDGFAAGFLDALSRGAGIDEALELGARVGAFACLTPGDWEGYPTPEQLKLLDGGGDTVTR